MSGEEGFDPEKLSDESKVIRADIALCSALTKMEKANHQMKLATTEVLRQHVLLSNGLCYRDDRRSMYLESLAANDLILRLNELNQQKEDLVRNNRILHIQNNRMRFKVGELERELSTLKSKMKEIEDTLEKK